MTQLLINSQDIPLVRIDFMNRTHQEEAQFVNSLAELVQARLNGEPTDSEISKQLGHWLQHMKAHFARENELMQETGFPVYPIHSEEHEIALSRMQTVIDAWEQNKDIELLKDYVFTLWPAWFKGHVNSMDKVTAEFALAHGYTTD